MNQYRAVGWARIMVVLYFTARASPGWVAAIPKPDNEQLTVVGGRMTHFHPANNSVVTSQARSRRAAWLWPTLIAFAAAIAVATIFVPILLYPPLGSHELSRLTASRVASISAQNDRLALQNNVRVALIQVIAGLAVLSGATVAWRQLRHTIEDARAHRLSERETLLLDHFSKAIACIGDDSPGVRLGGIYLLGMLAENSSAHSHAAHNVVSSFIRNNSPWPPAPAMPPIGTRPDRLFALGARAPDIQGAVTVLGASPSPSGTTDVPPLNNCDLRRANLMGAHFVGTDFTRSHLEWSSLNGARLDRVILRDADLAGADLSDADLTEADICGAVLSETKLSEVKLRDATFDGSTVWPADFTAADAERRGARRRT